LHLVGIYMTSNWQFLFWLLLCAIIPAGYHLQQEQRGIILCSYINVCYADSFHSITRQTMYMRRNIEARSCNYCYSGKAILITYSECVSVALCTHHAMRMRGIVICGFSGCTVFFVSHYLINGTIFGKKKLLNIKYVF